ncbi:MAG: acetyl-CoA carboxylase biotin carboxyl carrier protein subunit [Cytophagales bacterium]|nr:MAG: acetyl-CoA carboxylase biotin carboxyl carrier protein subunit [Cytophagales bacterium]TAF59396.1 MAG: acetyl-CoA carboxylase biotin carboxyl carrier protein subunit [Cytophagales bacterium]
MYKVLVNDQESFEVKTDNQQISIGDAILLQDMVQLNAHSYHLLQNDKSYKIEIVKADYETKDFEIKINQVVYKVNAKDRLDLLLQKMGMGEQSSAKIGTLKAPMPGLVLNVNVEVGQEVSKGDNLLILEAMKMENMLKAPASGLVKEVKVIKGQSVEKGQVLIVLA